MGRKNVSNCFYFSNEPEIIILDEPTAGQDYRVYTEIMSFLEKNSIRILVLQFYLLLTTCTAIEYTDRAIVLPMENVLEMIQYSRFYLITILSNRQV